MKKTIFIGSVISSKVALETLIEENIKIDLVCSLDEKFSKNVSDYYPIHEIAKKHNINYIKFKKINEINIVKLIENIDPDFIFVIGLSQIISKDILDLANSYSIGLHPTPLPKHRGRAALPWQILLGVEESKVTLFKLDKGMDSGDIIHQEPYIIEKNDYAMDVYEKVCSSLEIALKKCVSHIYDESINFTKQDNSEATYLLKRTPEDGKIDWNKSSKEILKLIRATSKPYPGAFTRFDNGKIICWKACVEENDKYIGLPGQIANIKNNKIKIITKDKLLVLYDYELSDKNIKLKIGKKFN